MFESFKKSARAPQTTYTANADAPMPRFDADVKIFAAHALWTKQGEQKKLHAFVLNTGRRKVEQHFWIKLPQAFTPAQETALLDTLRGQSEKLTETVIRTVPAAALRM